MAAKHSRIARIRETAQRYIDAETFSGIEWLIQHQGSILDTGSAGYACKAQQTPIPANAIYRIYSMTKPIVSIMGLMAIEQGRMHLFDPVARYLPGFANAQILSSEGALTPTTGPITVEHLFMHQSGLSYGFMPDCPVGVLYREHNLAEDGSRSLSDYVEALSTLPIAFEPGSRWHYSCSTDVLARIIEIVLEDSIAALLDKYIFGPLGMSDSGFSVNVADSNRLMPMYGKSLDEILHDPFSETPLKERECETAYPSHPDAAIGRGGHGLFSTASDYLEFALMTKSGRSREGEPLVSRKVLEFAWHNRLQPHLMPIAVGPFPQPGYGWNLLGRVMTDLGQAIHPTGMDEGGWAGAAATYYWVDRNEDLVGVIMTQNLGTLSPMRNDMQTATYQAVT